MIIEPLAFDSFSTRGMATFVKTKENSILIDPGIAIGPTRYSLPPANIELETLGKGRQLIIEKLKACNIVTISHYHYDHLPYPDDDVFNLAAFKDKIIYAKDTVKINKSQTKRNKEFEAVAKPIAAEIHYGDGNNYGNISLSPSVYHGSDGSRLGYVTMVSIEEGKEKLMHCSDVQGPCVGYTAEIIKQENPTFLIIGGPPSYFLGWKFAQRDLDFARTNILDIMENTQVKTLILDHHLLRDKKYKEKFFTSVHTRALELDIMLCTAAEYLGKKNAQLEANRKELTKKQEL